MIGTLRGKGHRFVAQFHNAMHALIKGVVEELGGNHPALIRRFAAGHSFEDLAEGLFHRGPVILNRVGFPRASAFMPVGRPIDAGQHLQRHGLGAKVHGQMRVGNAAFLLTGSVDNLGVHIQISGAIVFLSHKHKGGIFDFGLGAGDEIIGQDLFGMGHGKRGQFRLVLQGESLNNKGLFIEAPPSIIASGNGATSIQATSKFRYRDILPAGQKRLIQGIGQQPQVFFIVWVAFRIVRVLKDHAHVKAVVLANV